MDTAFVLITAGSALIAVIMAAICWRVVREDRRRATARVLALRAQLARNDADDAGVHLAVGHAPAVTARPASTRTPPRTFSNDFASDAADLSLQDQQMFSAVRDETGGRTRRPALLLAGLAVVIVIGGSIFLNGRAEEPGPDTTSSADSGAEAPALELLSLRHSRDGNRWTITGLVGNPAQASEVTGVSAVAFLFAKDGSFLGSGRAPLDFSTLAAGDESPFVITTVASGPVARYRISFRANEGRMVRHVDKRPMVNGVAPEGQER